MGQLPSTNSEQPLVFNGDSRWAVAFVALLFVHNEIHEIAHTGVGRLICGEWGPRNFNSWQLACSKTPEIVLAPLAGLLWSYGLMWIGYRLLNPAESPAKRSAGFCLVFATMPFGRLYTVAQSGGDEMVILRGAFPAVDPTLRLSAGLSIVLLLIGPPLYRAASVLSQQRRWIIFTGMLLLPFVLFLIVVLRIANPLLVSGVLASEGLLGSPLLVNIWTAFWVIVLFLFWRRLFATLVPKGNSTK